MNDNIDDLLKQMDSEKIVLPTPVSATEIKLSESQVNEFVINNAATIIANSVDAIESLKQSLYQATDPDEILAFSDLIKASSAALEVLNKISIQNKKAQSSKEIKQMDIESKKQLEGLKKPGNTNILIATREDIFKKVVQHLDDAKNTAEVIDVPTESDYKNHPLLPAESES